MFWELQGWPKQETLAVVINGDAPRYFRLAVAGNRLQQLLVAESDDRCLRTLEIGLARLVVAAQESGISLLLSILRMDGLRLSDGKFIWQRFDHAIHISPASLELINRWFFPLSGIGLILWNGNGPLPWIFYGGTPCQLRLEENDIALYRTPHDPSTPTQLVFVQQFRERHHLGLAMSCSMPDLLEIMRQPASLFDLVRAYGQTWLVSVPLEINDFLFNLPELLQFLPGKEKLSQCHIDREHLLGLIRLYLENGWNHLRRNPLYFELKDNEKRLLLELTTNGIYETAPQTKVPDESLFKLDIEILSTLSSWLNDTSLHLMARFIDEIMPAELAEKIMRKELLILLELQDQTAHQAQLFICGGEHDVPGNWQGDFSIVLVAPNRQVIFTETLPDAPLMVSGGEQHYTINFPPESCLREVSLPMRMSDSAGVRRGLAALTSDTSILAEITPGLRSLLRWCELVGQPAIAIAGHDYRIVAGRCLWLQTHGRILKNRYFIRHLSHAWITPTQGGLAVSGSPPYSDDALPWWYQFVVAKEKLAVVIAPGKTAVYPADQCFFPELPDSGRIELAHPQMGWQATHKVAVNFWLLNAGIVAFDTRGNCLLRIRALARVGKEAGFALLELPCRVPLMLEKSEPLPVTAKQDHDGIAFYVHGMQILQIHHRDYLRLLKPGTWWR